MMEDSEGRNMTMARKSPGFMMDLFITDLVIIVWLGKA